MVDYDDYPSGEPDTVSEECPECNGQEYTVEAACCYNPEAMQNGYCCGIPIPVQEQCQACKGTGYIETDINDYNDQRRDNEADLKRGEC